MTPWTVQIVEDDEPVAASLMALLESWGHRAEVFGDGEAILETPDTGPADCILMDLRLPGRDGLETLLALRANGVRTPVIMMTGHGDVAMATRAMQAGAHHFLEKPIDERTLISCMETAIGAHTEASDSIARLARLTPREYEVMREVAAGHANKVIAHRLGLSPKTVEIHRSRVMTKTGAESLSHLVRLVLKAGIDPDAPPDQPAGSEHRD